MYVLFGCDVNTCIKWRGEANARYNGLKAYSLRIIVKKYRNE